MFLKLASHIITVLELATYCNEIFELTIRFWNSVTRQTLLILVSHVNISIANTNQSEFVENETTFLACFRKSVYMIYLAISSTYISCLLLKLSRTKLLIYW